MAFLSRARMRLRNLCQAAVCEVGAEHSKISGHGFFLKQSHQSPCDSCSGFYTPTVNHTHQQDVHNNASGDICCILGAAKLLHARCLTKTEKSKGVQQSTCRFVQMSAEPGWNHPWTRDQLARRMSILRKRRICKEHMRLKFNQREGYSRYSTAFPEMPAPSQPLIGVLRPRTSEEAKVAPLLARPDLLVTRNVEWANLLVGFEQENRYVIMDPRESLSVVGFIVESSNWITRQVLRTRRPFHASIMDATGSVLFTVRRLMWFISSTIYAEIDGEVVGFAKRRWHLWRRNYDLYLGKRQFAVVENPGLWFWTFTLKDEDGRVLAEIDRNFRGFGYEMLTDAGQYAIRFGDVASDYHPPTTANTLTAEETHMQGITRDPGVESETFVSERPLDLLERVVTLALAISLDNDFFSRHVGGFFMFPFVSQEP